MCASRVCKVYDERSKISDNVASTTTSTAAVNEVRLLSDTMLDARFDVL